MKIKKWKNQIANVLDVNIYKDCDLDKYSTMGLKATGDLVKIKSVDALKRVLQILHENTQDFIVLGKGSNVLLSEVENRPYLLLELPFNKEIFKEYKESYILPASVHLSSLTVAAINHGLKGWEVFTGIPASLGGAVFMNAGTGLGEIASLVKRVWLIKANGKQRVQSILADSFSYRQNNFVKKGEVIFQVELAHYGKDEAIGEKIKKYLAKRNQTQPMKSKTCGCIFKNAYFGHLERQITCTAGQYIDIMGLKGLTIGSVRISEKHANFMENVGNATKSDVIKMIKVVSTELYLQYGIKFETEVHY